MMGKSQSPSSYYNGPASSSFGSTDMPAGLPRPVAAPPLNDNRVPRGEIGNPPMPPEAPKRKKRKTVLNSPVEDEITQDEAQRAG